MKTHPNWTTVFQHSSHNTQRNVIWGTCRNVETKGINKSVAQMPVQGGGGRKTLTLLMNTFSLPVVSMWSQVWQEKLLCKGYYTMINLLFVPFSSAFFWQSSQKHLNLSCWKQFPKVVRWITQSLWRMCSTHAQPISDECNPSSAARVWCSETYISRSHFICCVFANGNEQILHPVNFWHEERKILHTALTLVPVDRDQFACPKFNSKFKMTCGLENRALPPFNIYCHSWQD